MDYAHTLYADLAQKYSVGLQEIFGLQYVVLPGRKFFFPTLHILLEISWQHCCWRCRTISRCEKGKVTNETNLLIIVVPPATAALVP